MIKKSITICILQCDSTQTTVGRKHVVKLFSSENDNQHLIKIKIDNSDVYISQCRSL